MIYYVIPHHYNEVTYPTKKSITTNLNKSANCNL